MPNLRYAHICRYYANNRTELNMAKVFTKNNLVSNIFFLDNNVTGTTIDPNSGTKNLVNICFRSVKIKSYYDIDSENTCCDSVDCVNNSVCPHIAAVLLKIHDPISTKSPLVCSK